MNLIGTKINCNHTNGLTDKFYNFSSTWLLYLEPLNKSANKKILLIISRVSKFSGGSSLSPQNTLCIFHLYLQHFLMQQKNYFFILAAVAVKAKNYSYKNTYNAIHNPRFVRPHLFFLDFPQILFFFFITTHRKKRFLSFFPFVTF